MSDTRHDPIGRLLQIARECGMDSYTKPVERHIMQWIHENVQEFSVLGFEDHTESEKGYGRHLERVTLEKMIRGLVEKAAVTTKTVDDYGTTHRRRITIIYPKENA